MTPNPTFTRSRLRAAGTVAAAVLMLAACAGNDEEQTLAGSVTEAYETAQEAAARGNYRKAISIYEQLQARFPFSEISKRLSLDLMHAYYKTGNAERAIEAADQFMRENPTHDQLDYALYIKASSYFENDPAFLEKWFRKSTDGRPPRDAELAFSVYKRLVERYPASRYAEDSRQRMVYLKNRLAAYENEVARYYIKTGAFVAALNRAKNAVEQYNGADSNVESLEIMIRAYEGLGMSELADDTRRVLAENAGS